MMRAPKMSSEGFNDVMDRLDRIIERYEKVIEDARDEIDILTLFLSVANKPDLNDDTRKAFNNLIDSYLEGRGITLEEIRERHFPD